MNNRKQITMSDHQLNTDDYIFLKELGSGSYGQVFKARNNKTLKRVAIKYIDMSDTCESHLRLICREIKINIFLSRLEDNIFTVKLLDLFFPKGQGAEVGEKVQGVYMVIEYMKHTMDQMIFDSNENMSQKQVTVLIYNLLCTVKFLHSSNLIHRDLKPENLLITSHLEVKLCDFGLSRSIKSKEKKSSHQRRMSLTCFTRYYRPPEVILCQEEYDEKADVWSIGCIVSEVLQKMVKGPSQIEALFSGDSCFPVSPIQKMKEEEFVISENDQIIKIVDSLGITVNKISATDGEVVTHEYIRQICQVDQKHKGEENHIDALHEGVPDDLKELLNKMI